MDYEDIRDKWCRGLSGMIISRIKVLKCIQDKGIEMDMMKMINDLVECQKTLFNDDGLCHGNSKYSVLNTRTVDKSTLFNDNAGVGYMLVKLNQMGSTNNILVLS